MFGSHIEIKIGVINVIWGADSICQCGKVSRFCRIINTESKVDNNGKYFLARYENGKTKPPLALVKPLKILDHRPAC